MLFYLLDENLNKIDAIDTYKSAIWASRYFTTGDFELYLSATTETIELLKENYYLVREDDLTHAMIIQNIQLTTDVEQGNFLLVTGKDLKSILSRRIIWNQTILNGTVENCLRQLVTENCISSPIASRNISNLILGATIGLTDNVKMQFTGDNLETAVQTMCKAYGIGYDIMLDFEEKQFIFVLYKGTDRSHNQTEHPRVIFSNEFENLLTTDYTKNTDNYKNVAKVAGEGEGTARKTYVVGEASGLNRYEIFVDARDMSTNDGEVDETTYNELLAERGNEALAEAKTVETIEGEVESNDTYQINVDYFIGDVVGVVNEYGMTMTSRITEIIESDDDTGHYTIPTFASDESN